MLNISQIFGNWANIIVEFKCTVFPQDEVVKIEEERKPIYSEHNQAGNGILKLSLIFRDDIIFNYGTKKYRGVITRSFKYLYICHFMKTNFKVIFSHIWPLLPVKARKNAE
jgi:hypothetical protein